MNFIVIFWSNIYVDQKKVLIREFDPTNFHDPWIWSYHFSWSSDIILANFWFDNQIYMSSDPEYNKKMNPVPLGA